MHLGFITERNWDETETIDPSYLAKLTRADLSSERRLTIWIYDDQLTLCEHFALLLLIFISNNLDVDVCWYCVTPYDRETALGRVWTVDRILKWESMLWDSCDGMVFGNARHSGLRRFPAVQLSGKGLWCPINQDDIARGLRVRWPLNANWNNGVERVAKIKACRVWLEAEQQVGVYFKVFSSWRRMVRTVAGQVLAVLAFLKHVGFSTV